MFRFAGPLFGEYPFRSVTIVLLCLLFVQTRSYAQPVAASNSQTKMGSVQKGASELDGESRFAMQVAGGALATVGLAAMAGGLWPWLQNELAVTAGQSARNANDRAAWQNAQSSIEQARAADESWGRIVLGVGTITAGLGLLTMLGATWFSCPDEVE